MESKSKGEAAHLDASAKIGRGRGGDDGSEDGAALRADGGWRSAAAAAPGLARAASCLLYTSPSPRDQRGSRMPSSA